MKTTLTGIGLLNASQASFSEQNKSILCQEEPSLLELVRYIHLNPLCAGVVAHIAELDRFAYR